MWFRPACTMWQGCCLARQQASHTQQLAPVQHVRPTTVPLPVVNLSKPRQAAKAGPPLRSMSKTPMQVRTSSKTVMPKQVICSCKPSMLEEQRRLQRPMLFHQSNDSAAARTPTIAIARFGNRLTCQNLSADPGVGGSPRETSRGSAGIRAMQTCTLHQCLSFRAELLQLLRALERPPLQSHTFALAQCGKADCSQVCRCELAKA